MVIFLFIFYLVKYPTPPVKLIPYTRVKYSLKKIVFISLTISKSCIIKNNLHFIRTSKKVQLSKYLI